MHFYRYKKKNKAFRLSLPEISKSGNDPVQNLQTVNKRKENQEHIKKYTISHQQLVQNVETFASSQLKDPSMKGSRSSMISFILKLK